MKIIALTLISSTILLSCNNESSGILLNKNQVFWKEKNSKNKGIHLRCDGLFYKYYVSEKDSKRYIDEGSCYVVMNYKYKLNNDTLKLFYNDGSNEIAQQYIFQQKKHILSLRKIFEKNGNFHLLKPKQYILSKDQKTILKSDSQIFDVDSLGNDIIVPSHIVPELNCK